MSRLIKIFIILFIVLLVFFQFYNNNIKKKKIYEKDVVGNYVLLHIETYENKPEPVKNKVYLNIKKDGTYEMKEEKSFPRYGKWMLLDWAPGKASLYLCGVNKKEGAVSYPVDRDWNGNVRILFWADMGQYYIKQ